MVKVLACLAGAALVFGGAAQAIPLTARTVCVNCIGPRSDVLNPLEGTNDTPVPNGLISRSGYTQDELQQGLSKAYAVDVVAVADFLYSEKGVQFLQNSIGQNNYTPKQLHPLLHPAEQPSGRAQRHHSRLRGWQPVRFWHDEPAACG